MAYLTIKKVKGRYYGYMQESYREGGSVRTRTVEYLGAMEPAVAKQVQATRKQLGQADMAALVQSVRKASTAATRAPEPPPEAEAAPTTPNPTTEPPEPRYKRMVVNGTRAIVDTKTGELVSHDVDMTTGELFPVGDERVITTQKPTLRSFADSLKLPKSIETHELSRAALHGTHRRFGERLKRLEINPATMPDVVIAYGHPDGLKQRRNGSYTITASRQPKHGHTLNRAALWRNYRQALSRAMLDSIEAERPDLFAQLQSQLSGSHRAGKRLLFEHLNQTTSGIERLGLSLQLMLWDKLPAPSKPKRQGRKPKANTYQTKAQQDRQASAAHDLGQMSFDTVNNWREESALILAEAHKSGWGGLAEKLTKRATKHQAEIAAKKKQIQQLSKLEILAGKRRKIIREIMRAETKLAAVKNLRARGQVLRQICGP